MIVDTSFVLDRIDGVEAAEAKETEATAAEHPLHAPRDDDTGAVDRRRGGDEFHRVNGKRSVRHRIVSTGGYDAQYRPASRAITR